MNYQKASPDFSPVLRGHLVASSRDFQREICPVPKAILVRRPDPMTARERAERADLAGENG